jgi:propanol-preferring alcohol dehydrogenase
VGARWRGAAIVLHVPWRAADASDRANGRVEQAAAVAPTMALAQAHSPPTRRWEVTPVLAMTLQAARAPLTMVSRDTPRPGPGEVLLRVRACAVCRTDLHIVDGDLPLPHLPLVPGHEIVATVEALGVGVTKPYVGERVGVPWLGSSCGHCAYCGAQAENLCDEPTFTGYTRDGGFATHVLADARYCFSLQGLAMDDASAAPLMCAGLIGWRALKAAGDAPVIGLYGFGVAAHLIAQVALAQGRTVFAFTRPGDVEAQALARALACDWAGGSDESPPWPLDAAILFAPVGALVPRALAGVRKGGRVVCAGIHMSDIPSFPYSLLWQERQLLSVANLTRRDGQEFLALVRERPLRVARTSFALTHVNEALARLRAGELSGAAVLVP